MSLMLLAIIFAVTIGCENPAPVTVKAGPTGLQGPPGVSGGQGPEGLAGPKGITGSHGPEGEIGPQGKSGKDGTPGMEGPQGSPGKDGTDGVMPEKGPPGKDGADSKTPGPQGPEGTVGPQGPEGPLGATGPLGPQGKAGGSGPSGPAGPTGATGATGATGPSGPTGKSFLRNIPSTNVITALDATSGTAYAGGMPSVTIGSDGLGLIAYYYCGDINLQNGTCAPTSNLRVAHCSDTNCTAATITDLDTEGNVGDMSGIAVGADGLGLIAYYDSTNGNLKVAH